MSCPDWMALLQQRDRDGEEPPGWSDALAHLDACSSCRPRALALDPTLVFRRMAAPRVGEADVESMVQAVRALRRTHEVAPLPAASGLGEMQHRPWWARASRLAAAAALVTLGLTLGPSLPSRDAAPRVASVSASGAVADTVAEVDLEDGSYIEDLDLPDARVYQLASDETQIVMIVHPSLDL